MYGCSRLARLADSCQDLLHLVFQAPGIDPAITLIQRQPAIPQVNSLLVAQESAQSMEGGSQGSLGGIAIGVRPKHIGDACLRDVPTAPCDQDLQ